MDYQNELTNARRRAIWSALERMRQSERARDPLLTHAQRARLQDKVGETFHGHRRDQIAFSAVVLALVLIIGLAAGASTALYQWGSDVDGIRSEGIPVSCWHFREH